jgi:hypothetical protein
VTFDGDVRKTSQCCRARAVLRNARVIIKEREHIARETQDTLNGMKAAIEERGATIKNS